MWLLRLLGHRRMAGGDGDRSPLYVVVGLGNPGADYADHRHNVGFMTVHELAQRHHIAVTKRQNRALTGAGMIFGRAVLLAQPQTGMNASGRSVQQLRAGFDVPPERVLVIFDDLDLPLGRVRMRARGSAGGHHGLESIIGVTGTTDYPRIRVGIGRPASRDDVIDYVLAPFHRDEREAADGAVRRAADAVEQWLAEGIEAAMSAANAGVEQRLRAPLQTVRRQTGEGDHGAADHA